MIPHLSIQLEKNGVTYNTYDSWGLIPDGRLTISPPDIEEKFVDIPGRNGSLDLTEIQTGSAQRKNRTGSWDFYIVPYGYAYSNYGLVPAMYGKTPAWMAQKVATIIHGERVKVWLSDDYAHYYTGRVKVKSWPAGKTYSKITIEYNFDPFKKDNLTGVAVSDDGTGVNVNE